MPAKKPVTKPVKKAVAKPVPKKSARASFSVKPKDSVVEKEEPVEQPATEKVSSSVTPQWPTTDGLPVNDAAPDSEKKQDVVEVSPSQMPESDPISKLEKTNSKLYVAGTILFLGIIALTGAVFVVSQNQNMITPAKPVVVATPMLTPAPTPFLRGEVSFAVQNGSGKSGIGAKAAKALTDRGYSVVSVGNAPKRVKVTELYVTDTVPTLAAVVLADLANTFPVSSLSGVPRETTAAALLIVGPDFK